MSALDTSDGFNIIFNNSPITAAYYRSRSNRVGGKDFLSGGTNAMQNLAVYGQYLTGLELVDVLTSKEQDNRLCAIVEAAVIAGLVKIENTFQDSAVVAAHMRSALANVSNTSRYTTGSLAEHRRMSEFYSKAAEFQYVGLPHLLSVVQDAVEIPHMLLSTNKDRFVWLVGYHLPVSSGLVTAALNSAIAPRFPYILVPEIPDGVWDADTPTTNTNHYGFKTRALKQFFGVPIFTEWGSTYINTNASIWVFDRATNIALDVRYMPLTADIALVRGDGGEGMFSDIEQRFEPHLSRHVSFLATGWDGLLGEDA